AQPSSASTLQFNANGTPNLKGMTIRVGNAAGSAHIGDTNVHDMVQFLNQWGASASQSNASANAPELAVESGRLDVAVGPLPTEVDSGLVVFGPNQARLDDELLAKPSISGLSGLKGKTIAYCCAASPDGVLLAKVLQQAGLSQSQVRVLATGASSSSLSALISGQVDAAFTAASGLPPTASKFKMLGTATQLVPQYADSFMAAQGSWLSAHPAEAEAVDLAWLASAKLFNNDQATWVKNAASYTSNADSQSQYQQAWQQLKDLGGWPLSDSTYTTAAVNYNLQIAQQQSALKGQGTRPAAQETNTSAWQGAWKLFQQHQGAL
ncbi:MAG: ABC transporter substrate-binding protein, partial [Acidimicrobiales bacterium]